MSRHVYKTVQKMSVPGPVTNVLAKLQPTQTGQEGTVSAEIVDSHFSVARLLRNYQDHIGVGRILL